MEKSFHFFDHSYSFENQELLRHHFRVIFSIDGAFVIVTSDFQLPDISTQNSTKDYQNSHKSEIFSKKVTSGNPDVAFLVGVWKPLFSWWKFSFVCNSLMQKCSIHLFLRKSTSFYSFCALILLTTLNMSSPDSFFCFPKKRSIMHVAFFWLHNVILDNFNVHFFQRR